MNRSRRLAAGLLAAASGVTLSLAATSPALADRGGRGGSAAGQVYEVTNSATGNAVQVFDRARDGSLSVGALVPTGGLGAGTSLGSQGAAVRDGNVLLVGQRGGRHALLLPDPGGRLVLRDVPPTGGVLPVSVAEHDGLVYVLNAGSGTLTGLRLTESGTLRTVADSTRALGGSAVGAAQVQFDARGDRVVVTEKATNQLLTFPVREHGLLAAPTVTPSEGATPFGFDVDARNHVVVSEAGSGSLSSYRFDRAGLTAITGAVPDSQAAACWVEIVGGVAYTTNAASSTISSFAIGRDGSLTLLAAVAATTGAGPTDLAASQDGRNLYVRTGDGLVDEFSVARDGSLTGVGTIRGTTSIGTAGLAAR